MKSGNDGIICDYCNDHLTVDFIYYSYDFYRVDVHANNQTTNNAVEISSDLCQRCMDAYAKRVKDAYVRPIPGKFNCDISGEVTAINSGDFTYYRCLISKVNVKLSDIPFKCSICHKIRNISDGRCCSNGVLVREAVVEVDDKFLSLNFSVAMYNKFREHMALRQ